MPESTAAGPLHDVKVVDAATIFAGPMIGTLFGDFGADVIKVEHPRGDGIRGWEWRKDDVSLWWELVGRNKRSIALVLSEPEGADLLKAVLRDSDVFIENFRPGTLEKWGLSPEVLWEINPSLVIVRVSGYGQTGPYSSKPGFGTLAEALSGFAYTNGAEDGPPVLPQWPLADGATALAGAFSAMSALRHAEKTGEGQVVDLSIYEPLFYILGAQTSAYQQLGEVPHRQGSRTDFNIPRGAYRTSDDRWVALSGATTTAAQRIMRAIGRDDLADAPWFKDISGRSANRDEIDASLSSWIAERSMDQALQTFSELGATVGPIYSQADISTDSHFRERGSIITVDHPVLGPLEMQGPIAQLSKTPGAVSVTAPGIGEHSDEILRELLETQEKLEEHRRRGVIGPSPSQSKSSEEGVAP